MDDQQLAYALELEAEQWQAERAAALLAECRYSLPINAAEWACYAAALADNIYEEQMDKEQDEPGF